MLCGALVYCTVWWTIFNMLYTATVQSAVCICRAHNCEMLFIVLWGIVGSCLRVVDPQVQHVSAYARPLTGSSISPLCALFALSWKGGLACCTGQRWTLQWITRCSAKLSSNFHLSCDLVSPFRSTIFGSVVPGQIILITLWFQQLRVGLEVKHFKGFRIKSITKKADMRILWMCCFHRA